MSKNPLGLTDVPVFVDARPHSWMLDPTAPFNLISRSQAKEAGLKISEESRDHPHSQGQRHPGARDRDSALHHQRAADVSQHDGICFDDADYYFPQSKYQVEGVLGYAALPALGSLTVTDSNRLYVQSGQAA